LKAKRIQRAMGVSGRYFMLFAEIEGAENENWNSSSWQKHYIGDFLLCALRRWTVSTYFHTRAQ
jgi:hypothetical protein